MNANLRNRIHTAKNPYQGPMKKILCVCSAGLLRSPTMAVVIARYGYNTRAAGIEPAFSLIPVDPVLIHWADFIICASVEIKNRLLEQFGSVLLNDTNSRVLSFNISDDYEYMQRELVQMIQDQFLSIRPLLSDS